MANPQTEISSPFEDPNSNSQDEGRKDCSNEALDLSVSWSQSALGQEFGYQYPRLVGYLHELSPEAMYSLLYLAATFDKLPSHRSRHLVMSTQLIGEIEHASTRVYVFEAQLRIGVYGVISAELWEALGMELHIMKRELRALQRLMPEHNASGKRKGEQDPSSQRIESDPSILKREMETFVMGQGGEVRFDLYMSEHLFSPLHGFYHYARIGESGDFSTLARIPEFAHLLYLYSRIHNLSRGAFLEIGGGSGDFKYHFRSVAAETSYISVEPSTGLRSRQSEYGGITVSGSATQLPFEERELSGVVFANELIDALPVRLFEVKRGAGGPHVANEVYISVDSSGFLFSLAPVQRDEFVLIYERYLCEKLADIPESSVVAVAPDTVYMARELKRVLRNGRGVFCDYGFCEGGGFPRPSSLKDLVYYTDHGNYCGLDAVLANPYLVDITYKVDFDFLAWVFKEEGFGVKIHHQANFCGGVMMKYEWIVGGAPCPSRFNDESSHLLSARDFFVLEWWRD